MFRTHMAMLSPIAFLIALLGSAGKAQAQDERGVVGWEVFTTRTPGGGGQPQSTGLTGERTDFPLAVDAPTTAGTAVTNITVLYFDSAESRDKEKKRREEARKAKHPKPPVKKSNPPNVFSFDPRFYELKDGKVVKKEHPDEGRPRSQSQPDVQSGPKKPDILWDPIRTGPGATESGPKKPDILWDPIRQGAGTTESGPKKPDMPWDPVRPLPPSIQFKVAGYYQNPAYQPSTFDSIGHFIWWVDTHSGAVGSIDDLKNHVVMTGTVVAGQPTTVTAVDGRGAVISGAVIELPDGKQVTTDRNGRAQIEVPIGLAALTLGIAGGSKTTSWVNPNPCVSQSPAIQVPSTIEHGQLLTLRGASLPSDSAILVDGIPGNVLAQSPTGLVVALPKGLSPGEHNIALIHDGMAVDMEKTVVVQLTISPPKTLTVGQRATFQVTVAGTSRPLDIEVFNGSPSVVSLGASSSIVRSSGGNGNVAKIVVTAIGPGTLSLPCRVRPGA